MPEPIGKILELAQSLPLLDVRTPDEFQKGHIPGAINLPIFSNEERAEIGTLYKQKSRDIAVRRGLEIVGPKMASFVAEADKLGTKELCMYCWRGGMRSGSMAWLLQTAGFTVHLLDGGYKSYRRVAIDSVANDFQFLILGGYTGTAKTHILNIMAEKGAQVVDLEGIARHKGSAFGNLEQVDQPTTEYFGNLVYEKLRRLDPSRSIWLEDESKSIGTVYLNDDLYRHIRSSHLIFVERTLEERAAFLAKDYGTLDKELLKYGFEKIKQRLGGDRLKTAFEYIENGELAKAAAIGLHYYDKTYTHGLGKRDPKAVTKLSGEGKTHEEIAQILIERTDEWTK